MTTATSAANQLATTNPPSSTQTGGPTYAEHENTMLVCVFMLGAPFRAQRPPNMGGLLKLQTSSLR